MAVELQYLVWSVALLILHIAVQASFSVLSIGVPYALSARDEDRVPENTIAKRLERALANFLETYPAFIALALILAVASTSTGMTAAGAALWFWARVVYVLVYAAGVPFVRTLIWVASVIGLIMMLWPLLFG